MDHLARQVIAAGLRLLEDARYAEAAAALERSLALRESPSVLYNLALAYRGTGSYLRAIATFERFLNAAPEREPLRRDAAAIAGELRGALAPVRADDLAAHALRALLARNPAAGERVDEVPEHREPAEA